MIYDKKKAVDTYVELWSHLGLGAVTSESMMLVYAPNIYCTNAWQQVSTTCLGRRPESDERQRYVYQEETFLLLHLTPFQSSLSGMPNEHFEHFTPKHLNKCGKHWRPFMMPVFLVFRRCGTRYRLGVGWRPFIDDIVMFTGSLKQAISMCWSFVRN